MTGKVRCREVERKTRKFQSRDLDDIKTYARLHGSFIRLVIGDVYANWEQQSHEENSPEMWNHGNAILEEPGDEYSVTTNLREGMQADASDGEQQQQQPKTKVL